MATPTSQKKPATMAMCIKKMAISSSKRMQSTRNKMRSSWWKRNHNPSPATHYDKKYDDVSTVYSLTSVTTKESFFRDEIVVHRTNEAMQQAINNAIQRIKNARKIKRKNRVEIIEEIEDNVEKANARLDHSNNMIGAGLAMKTVKKLQNEYDHINMILDKLKKLEKSIECGSCKARLVDEKIKFIISLEKKQIQTIHLTDAELIEELRAGICYSFI